MFPAGPAIGRAIIEAADQEIGTTGEEFENRGVQREAQNIFEGSRNWCHRSGRRGPSDRANPANGQLAPTVELPEVAGHVIWRLCFSC